MSENEYKEWVLAYYDEKLKAGELPSELLLPTPANIKAELIKVCEKGLSSDDQKIIRSFIGEKSDISAYRTAISIGKADPFRPLVNVLKNRSIDTNQRNIDLLALLLDFKPRPFHFTLVILPKTISPTIGATKTGKPHEPKPENIDSPPSRNLAYKISMLIGILLVVVIAGYIGIRLHQERVAKYGCMLWSDDHYEPVDCNDHSSGSPLYPIKHELVDHFKKIAEPKTLTLGSLGKVWYGKYNGNIDFFTDSGPYPLDTNRRVLPMSIHIYQKYILHTTN